MFEVSTAPLTGPSGCGSLFVVVGPFSMNVGAAVPAANCWSLTPPLGGAGLPCIAVTPLPLVCSSLIEHGSLGPTLTPFTVETLAFDGIEPVATAATTGCCTPLFGDAFGD